ncbi:GTP-binding nuclear protein Ran [Orchesella cincta]|uniref:GTP-binding nuclear protein Ran n=1 Tax=Orchesella cincta TaxID=48709 RepID=A0A1D2M749_ORCCI|nr:GTP-binding nuclear protein Ran [Orchesella cincta]
MAPIKVVSTSTAVKSFFSSRRTRSMASPVKLTKFTSLSSPPWTTLPVPRRSPRLSSRGSPQLRRSPRLSSHQPPAEKIPSPRRKLKPKIQMSHSWNCLIVGNGGVGKSTFIKKSIGDPFRSTYKRTTSKEKSKCFPISFSSTRGWLTFNVYDTVGKEGSRVLHKNVNADRDCGIIMFDLMSESSYIKKVKWYAGLKYNFAERAAKGRLCSMVLVGTKDDLEGPQKLNADGIRKHHGLQMEFVNISSVSNQNLHHPFLMLARDLLGDKNLEFLPIKDRHKKLLERQMCNVGILDIPK